ncbi:hypothetical protein JQS43_04275 [Natronosporangium hydrolyticum]|uniref:Uncharacterized protein n=1 Tax=Natronosporangium hydrolyticum TaxID=2811111 RepID=A0A895YCL7_9ACTN|nr:hypothetical protein [Natronosporangium hydrolyticum]QSB15574.1 hypothetical protein JQS43_04275 [Natronosporangium hydrolyticum]
MSLLTVRRPGVVTFVAVVVLIQAVMAAAVALVTIGLAGDDRVQSATGLGTAGLVWTGIVEALVAVVLFVVAGGLLSGAQGARLFVAIVEGIRMVTAVIFMIVYHTGGYLYNAVIAVIIGLFVLWALYVYPSSDEYFRRSIPERDFSGRPE